MNKKQKCKMTVCCLAAGMVVSLLVLGDNTMQASAAAKKTTAPAKTAAVVTENESEEFKKILEESDSDDVKQVIAFIKEKAKQGELETEADFRDAIREGEEEFDVTLSEDNVDRIVSVAKKLKGLGLSSEELVAQVEVMYDKYGAQLVDEADEAIREAVSDAVTQTTNTFWEGVKKSISGFFKNIFES